MDECLLCRKTPADKTGSHVIPFFLIKTMVNEEGKKGRDREISFKIGADNTDTYIGRSVSIESIQEVLGREPTEADFVHNLNHYTQDHFLCSNCEKRLSYIESYYSNKGKVNDTPNNLVSNGVESEIALLFWSSIVWRISVTDFGPKLTVKEERKLRYILDICLGLSIEETKAKAEMHSQLLKDWQTIILYEAPIENPTSKMYSTAPGHRFPYSYVINDYTLFFYFKRSHINNLEQSFFGLEKFQDPKFINTIDKEHETVYVISENDAAEARWKVNNYKVEERTASPMRKVSYFIKKHLRHLHVSEQQNIINDIHNELVKKDYFSMNQQDKNVLANVMYTSVQKFLH